MAEKPLAKYLRELADEIDANDSILYSDGSRSFLRHVSGIEKHTIEVWWVQPSPILIPKG